MAVTLLFGRVKANGVYHAFMPDSDNRSYSLCGNATYPAGTPLASKGKSRQCARCGAARALCARKNIPVQWRPSYVRKTPTNAERLAAILADMPNLEV